MASSDSKSVECSEVLAVSQAVNYLGFHLYQELAKEKSNLFFSPLSLSTALGLLFCGSRNKTSQEMKQVLGYEAASISDGNVSECFKSLQYSLEQTPDSYELTNANLLFSKINVPLKDDFKKIIKECFKAMSFEVDFHRDSAKAVQLANDWVNSKTNGMIPQLVESFDPNTVLVILNAVYFKGFWKHTFHEDLTYEQLFYNKGLESSAKKVDMMHIKESFPYVENDSFQAIRLPYKGEDISMLIVLPKNINGLEELENQLSLDFIAKLKTQLFVTEVIIGLPKFRLEYTKSLKPDFQILGMGAAFGSEANFDGISESGNIYVSDVVHKAVLEVNEEGSEAAAVSEIWIPCCAFRTHYEFTVNHPFNFLIYNSKTDLTLFMGRVDEL